MTQSSSASKTTKVNLDEKFALFDTAWDPKRIGKVNDCDVKIVKLRGDFVWHTHDVEDELFFVTKGRLKMEFRDRVEIIGPGELIIVPAGVEHRPVTETDEVQILLIEREGVVNTGDAVPGEMTRQSIEDLV